MATAPPLSEFMSQVSTRNVAKPYLYYVEIIPPKSMETESKDNRLVSMWCNGSHTPMLTINTNDDYIEAGVRRKYAYDVDYQNLILSFYVDQNYQTKKFFDDWKQRIVPYHRRFNYPEEYTSDRLNLYLIDQEGNDVYLYRYSKVYPKTVNSIELSYSQNNSPTTFSVEFVFEDVYYTAITADNSELGFSSEPTLGSIDDLPKLGNVELSQTIKDKIYKFATDKFLDTRKTIGDKLNNLTNLKF